MNSDSIIPSPEGKQPLEYAAYFWGWFMHDPDSDEHLDPRDPHGIVEDTLITVYGHNLQQAQSVSSFALQGVLKANAQM